MIKKPTFLIVTCLILLISSCLDTSSKNSSENLLNTDFELVNINNQYSMEVPDFMKESKELNDEASLQYQNIFKEVYIIVIDESREEFKTVFQDLGEYDDEISMVENYKSIQLEFLQEAITIHSKEDVESSVINGLPFEIVKVDATSDGIDIAYTIAYIDGPENVYMIMAWTEKDKREKNEALFQKMIKSFKISTRTKGVTKNPS
jgi:hypothetical protein